MKWNQQKPKTRWACLEPCCTILFLFLPHLLHLLLHLISATTMGNLVLVSLDTSIQLASNSISEASSDDDGTEENQSKPREQSNRDRWLISQWSPGNNNKKERHSSTKKKIIINKRARRKEIKRQQEEDQQERCWWMLVLLATRNHTA